MKLSVALIASIAALAPSVATAQGRGKPPQKPDTAQEIPASSRPPAGMCRIWLSEVPTSQQPAPTDCATAVRNRPAKGRVIFGDDYARSKAKKGDSARVKVPVRGFAPVKGVTTRPDTSRRGTPRP